MRIIKKNGIIHFIKANDVCSTRRSRLHIYINHGVSNNRNNLRIIAFKFSVCELQF